MYGYGPSNVIDFTKFPSNEIIGIFGNNAIGKSSLLNIIIYMLYSRSALSSALPKDIVNVNTDRARGKMYIESNNIIYLIKRTCGRCHRKDNTIELKHRTEFYELIEFEPNESDHRNIGKKDIHIINGKSYKKKNKTDVDRTKTDILLRSIVGTYDNFALTTMLLQEGNSTFKYKTDADKKIFLYNILKLNHLDNVSVKIGDTITPLNKEIIKNEKDISNISLKSCDVLKEENRLSNEILQMTKEDILILNITLEQFESANSDLLTQKYKIDNSKHIIKTCDELEKYEEILDNKQKEFKSLLIDIESLKYQILQCDNQIEELTTITNKTKIKEDYKLFTDQLNKKQSSISKNIDRLTYSIQLYQSKEVNYSIEEIKDQIINKEENFKKARSDIKDKEDSIIVLNSSLKELTLIHQKESIVKANIKYHDMNRAKQEELYHRLGRLNTQKELIQMNKIPDGITIDICMDKLNDLNSQQIIIEEYFESDQVVNFNNTYSSVCFDYKLLMDSNENLIYTKIKELNQHLNDKEIFNSNIDTIISSLDIVFKKTTTHKLIDKYKEFQEFKKSHDEQNTNYKTIKDLIISTDLILTNINTNNKYLEEIAGINSEILILKNEIDKIKIITNTQEFNLLQEELDKQKYYIDQIKDIKIIIERTHLLVNILETDIIKLNDDIETINKNEKSLDEKNYINQEIKKLTEELNIINTQSLTDEKFKLYQLFEEEQKLYLIITEKKLNYTKKLSELNKKQSELSFEINKFESGISDYVNVEKLLKENASIQLLIDQLLQKITIKKLDISTNNKSMILIKNQIDQNVLIINNLIKQIDILNINKNKKTFYELLGKICGKNGLQLYLLNQYLVNINRKVNQILVPFINKKINLVLDNNNIDLQIITNNKIINSLSGMEGLMLDVVFKIIIGQISLIPKTNFIFIDESISVFDKDRMDNISDFFDFLTKYYSNVFLITHMEQIKPKIKLFLDITKKYDFASICNDPDHYNDYDSDNDDYDVIVSNDINSPIGLVSKSKNNKKKTTIITGSKKKNTKK